MSNTSTSANVRRNGDSAIQDGHIGVWNEASNSFVDGGEPGDIAEGATVEGLRTDVDGLRTDVDTANRRDTLIVVGNDGLVIDGALAGVYASTAATANVELTLPALADVKGQSCYVLAPAAHETIITAGDGDTINSGATAATDVGAIVQVVAGDTEWRTIGPLD